MSYLTTWHQTYLPSNIIDSIIKDVSEIQESSYENSTIGSDKFVVEKNVRDSKTAWISTNYWLGSFLWYYLEKANRENYQYDITCIDGENFQLIQYQPGSFYNWHVDSGLHMCNNPTEPLNSRGDDLEHFQINREFVRKLSFSLQLSNEDEYEGGELQFLDNERKLYTCPKEKGTLIIFDSRTPHRVRKIRSGLRKSVVGWAIGPRWK